MKNEYTAKVASTMCSVLSITPEDLMKKIPKDMRSALIESFEKK